MPKRSEQDFLHELRRRGARRLVRVAFRTNRVRIWSLTRGGTVMNLHSAYRSAPDGLLDALAALAVHARRKGRAFREAAEAVRSWPGLEPALAAARAAHAEERKRGARRGGGGSQAQRAYLRALYRYFNETRFGGRLPGDVPLRLSHRMRTSLGHIVPGRDPQGGRYVAEIAINADLMLEGNAAARVDTLLHEMAHVAAYLFHGSRRHDEVWRRWARRVGCRPRRCHDLSLTRREQRRQKVGRIPPLPPALRLPAA